VHIVVATLAFVKVQFQGNRMNANVVNPRK